MTNQIRILFIAVILISFQLLVNAQENQHFLHKVGVVDSLFSAILNETREIYIELPPGYNPENHQKFPVAYILDGEIFLPTVSIVQDFYSGGFMPEMVLVGISNNKNRTRDLTTSTILTKNGMPFDEKNGEADNFIKFIEKELIPYVEGKYPATNYRTLIGHSYGGLFTVYSLIKHSHLFANYLAIDPSLDWNNQKLLEEAQGVLASQNFKGKALYMSLSGKLHMQNLQITIENVMQDTSDFTLFARSNIAFSNLIEQNKQNGLFYKWEFFPEELHGTIAFPSIKNGLTSLFEWFQMENTDKINSPNTSKEELFNIVKNRERKLESHFGYRVPPYPEFLLNMSGYMNMDMKQPEKAKMYFELAIEYYPESANSFDSMADYYESLKDYDNALKYVTKAYKLSGDDYHRKRMEELKMK